MKSYKLYGRDYDTIYINNEKFDVMCFAKYRDDEKLGRVLDCFEIDGVRYELIHAQNRIEEITPEKEEIESLIEAMEKGATITVAYRLYKHGRMQAMLDLIQYTGGKKLKRSYNENDKTMTLSIVEKVAK